MAWIRAATIAALFIWSSKAAAQDVMLTSPDGTIELSGSLLGFDGEFYRLDTIYGELTIDGSGVVCEGPGCPNLQNFIAEVSISGSATMGALLVPALLEGFAIRNSYSVTRETVDASHLIYVLRNLSDEAEVARFFFHVSTTDEGFADMLANDADIVMALREMRSQERIRARKAGLGDLSQANRSRVLALDAMVR